MSVSYRENSHTARILVVDDEVQLMEALCEGLRLQGFEAIGVVSGVEALTTMESGGVDIVLTDLMMPGMDGVAVLTAGLAMDPDIVGVIMTGQGTVQTAVEAMKAGAFDYVLKPFSLQKLVPVLERGLETRRLRLENLQLRQTVAVHELIQTVSHTLDSATILQKLADAALQQLDANEVSILIPSADGLALIPHAAAGENHSLQMEDRFAMDPQVFRWVEREKEALSRGEPSVDTLRPPVRVPARATTTLWLPMLTGGKLVGIIAAQGTTRPPFTAQHARALGILAGAAAAAVESSFLFKRVAEAEEKYRTIFENAQEGLFQFSVNGSVLAANQAMAAMFGYASPAELMWDVHDFREQLVADRDQYNDFVSILKQRGSVQAFQGQARTKSGDIIWLSVSSRLVGANSGRDAYFEGSAEDVTQRRKAAEEVRESQRFLQSTLNALSAHIAVLDETGIIVAVNAAWEHFASANHADPHRVGLGVNYLKVCEKSLGQDRNPSVAAARGIEAVLQGSIPSFHMEYPCHSLDEKRWFLLHATRFGGEGPVRVVVAHENVTKFTEARQSLSESEERFRQMAETVQEVFWMSDPATSKMLYVNPAYETIWGRSCLSLYENPASFMDAIHPDDKASAVEAVNDKANAGGFDCRYRIVRPGGEVRWIRDRAFPIRDAAHHVYRVVGIAQDITDQKLAEDSLRQSHDELEQRVQERTLDLESEISVRRAAEQAAEEANRSKSDFLSRMSHELRTPLNAILGFAQLLDMSGRLHDRDNMAVGHISKAGAHLLELINEVLDIARIEAGHISISPEAISVGQIMCEAFDLVRPIAAGREIVLTNLVAETDERYVRADRQRMRQTLLNLLTNGIKYNREGGSVEASIQTSGKFLRVNVVDTGHGLSADEITHLFVPFQRLWADKTNIEGTGIGLVLCKRLVESMGGQIGVESTLGSGSTFWFALPLDTFSEGRPTEQPGTSAAADGAPVKFPTQEPRTVLYIEDNLANFMLVETILLEYPHVKLLRAEDGARGVELAARNVPDLVLLDLHLPDIAGELVIRQLKDNPSTREIPVVVVSADAMPAKIEAIHAMGVEDYLTKPINVHLFIEIVGRNLNYGQI